MKTNARKRLLGRPDIDESIISPRCRNYHYTSTFRSEFLELDYTNSSERRCLLVRSIRKSNREVSSLHFLGGMLVICRAKARYRTYCSNGAGILSITQHGPAWRGKFTVQFDNSTTLKTFPGPALQWSSRKDFEVTHGSSVIRGSFSASKTFKDSDCCLGNLASNRFASVALQSSEEICEHFGARETYQMAVAFLAWTERNFGSG